MDIEPLEEEKKEEHFKLEEEDFMDKATIGLKLQEFIAKEQIKDLIAMGKLPKDTKLEGTTSPISSRAMRRLRAFPIRNSSMLITPANAKEKVEEQANTTENLGFK